MNGGFFTLKGIGTSSTPYTLNSTQIAIHVDKINQFGLQDNATKFSQIVLDPLGIEPLSVPHLGFDLVEGQDTLRIIFSTIETYEEAIQLLRIYSWLKWGTDGDTYVTLSQLLEQEYINTTHRITLTETMPIRRDSDTDLLIRITMLPGVDFTAHIDLITAAMKDELHIEVPNTGNDWIKFEADSSGGLQGVITLRQIFPAASDILLTSQSKRVQVLRDGSKIVSLLKKGVFNHSAVSFGVLNSLDSTSF